jgi:hypothetical protein
VFCAVIFAKKEDCSIVPGHYLFHWASRWLFAGRGLEKGQNTLSLVRKCFPGIQVRLAQLIEQEAHFSTFLSDRFLKNDKNVGSAWFDKWFIQ